LNLIWALLYNGFGSSNFWLQCEAPDEQSILNNCLQIIDLCVLDTAWRRWGIVRRLGEPMLKDSIYHFLRGFHQYLQVANTNRSLINFV
jgi:hypothetical protein